MAGFKTSLGRFLRVGSPSNSGGRAVSSPPPQVRAARIRARFGCEQILFGRSQAVRQLGLNLGACDAIACRAIDVSQRALVAAVDATPRAVVAVLVRTCADK